MKTRTIIEIPRGKISIDHSTKALTLGSCFADRIGGKLQKLKFSGIFNPYGVLFNPVSILKCLSDTIHHVAPDEQHFCHKDGVFVHHDYHSDIWGSSLSHLNKLLLDHHHSVRYLLPSTNLVILTLGTSWVYELIHSGQVVANCHKQPSNSFQKKLLTYNQCFEAIQDIITLLRTLCPDVHIVITISPVRHLRDTLIQNNRSKSTLCLAVHDILEVNDGCTYFPSFEIMNDDLRDYRYYADDMIHPSPLAMEYIWQLFSTSFFSEQTMILCQKIEKIVKAINHKPFNSASPQYQSFVAATLSTLEELEKIDSSLDLTAEREQLESYLLS